MEKIEKVIHALKCCRANEDEPCAVNCPYWEESDECIGKVMDDALEVLRELRDKETSRRA